MLRNLVLLYDSDGKPVKSEPLFKTEKEYEQFRQSFAEEMKPELDEQARRRAMSELESMNHWVD